LIGCATTRFEHERTKHHPLSATLETMPKFFTPADRPEEWRKLLAKPHHWKTGFSAKSIAYSWTEAKGFPTEVRSMLEGSGLSPFTDLEFLLGFPEYEVPLPGGSRPSQNDVFVLARGMDGLVTIAVEGKVFEPFDKPVDERFEKPTPGELERLNYLCSLLRLKRAEVGPIGYQLLHRTASALIEARRFGAQHAVMLVHSFSASLESFTDYASFASLYGIKAEQNRVAKAGDFDGVGVYFGWSVGNPEYRDR
jgi:hypothetical protein